MIRNNAEFTMYKQCRQIQDKTITAQETHKLALDGCEAHTMTSCMFFQPGSWIGAAEPPRSSALAGGARDKMRDLT